MQYTGTMDPEVVDLCDALNEIPHIHTSSSCSGHGHDPLMIWFESTNPAWLFVLGRGLSRNYGGYGFRCVLEITDLPEKPVVWLLESLEVGEAAFQAATDLADRLRYVMSRKDVLKLFRLED